MAALTILDACTLFGPWPRHVADLPVETLLQGMAQNKISHSLVTATSGIFYDYRQGNDETLAVAKDHSSQLFPVATLDPRAYPECLEEVQTRAREGFRFFRFFPVRQDWPLHFAPFHELLQACDAAGVPVAVTVSQAGDCTALAEAVSSLKVPVLLAGVTSRLLPEVLSVMRSETKFYVETTRLFSPGTFETIRDQVPQGAERLVFASYAPLHYLSVALAPVLTSSLSNEEKAAVLGGNLKRLLAQ